MRRAQVELNAAAAAGVVRTLREWDWWNVHGEPMTERCAYDNFRPGYVDAEGNWQEARGEPMHCTKLSFYLSDERCGS